MEKNKRIEFIGSILIAACILILKCSLYGLILFKQSFSVLAFIVFSEEIFTVA